MPHSYLHPRLLWTLPGLKVTQTKSLSVFGAREFRTSRKKTNKTRSRTRQKFNTVLYNQPNKTNNRGQQKTKRRLLLSLSSRNCRSSFGDLLQDPSSFVTICNKKAHYCLKLEGKKKKQKMTHDQYRTHLRSLQNQGGSSTSSRSGGVVTYGGRYQRSSSSKSNNGEDFDAIHMTITLIVLVSIVLYTIWLARRSKLRHERQVRVEEGLRLQQQRQQQESKVKRHRLILRTLDESHISMVRCFLNHNTSLT